LSEYVGEDTVTLQFLLTKFIERSSELTHDMRASLQSRDYANLSNQAHRMKSAALTVGAQVLAQSAQALENVARAQFGPITETLIEHPPESLFKALVHNLEVTHRAIGTSTLAQTTPVSTNC
jgi:HPt (histidine-containing phosphotransfer) domain-containing protein